MQKGRGRGNRKSRGDMSSVIRRNGIDYEERRTPGFWPNDWPN